MCLFIFTCVSVRVGVYVLVAYVCIGMCVYSMYCTCVVCVHVYMCVWMCAKCVCVCVCGCVLGVGMHI